MRGMHLCSCVAKRVQKSGMLVALGVLACAWQQWQQRYEGRRWTSAAVPLRFVGMLKGTYLTGGTSKRGTSINVALAAVHDFFWDYHALTTKLDELEWADGVEAGVPYKWV